MSSRYPLVDSHNDLPWEYRKLVRDAVWSYDISGTGGPTQTNIPWLKEGRVGGQIWSVYVSCQNYSRHDAVRATQEQIDVVEQLLRRYDTYFKPARSAADIQTLFDKGYLPSLMGIEVSADAAPKKIPTFPAHPFRCRAATRLTAVSARCALLLALGCRT